MTRQTIARWARLRPTPLRWVLDALKDPVQQTITEAHAAPFELNLLAGPAAAPAVGLAPATRVERSASGDAR